MYDADGYRLVPEAFQHPDEFIPERWTTRPELVLDDRAYAPFSVGEFLSSPS
jgi:cytochrome P450